jgi:hypothetical protein
MIHRELESVAWMKKSICVRYDIASIFESLLVEGEVSE